jgi:hypothetical protein
MKKEKSSRRGIRKVGQGRAIPAVIGVVLGLLLAGLLVPAGQIEADG